MNCPECKQGRLVKRYGEYETTYVDRNGQTQALVVPEITWLECNNCGEVVLENKAMSLIEAARRKALGLLTLSEIRAFRLRLGKTQKSMSEFLGVGEKTYCRWESGSYVQSEASDRYLRLLISDEANIRTLNDIAKAKEPDRSVGSPDDLELLFPYLSDPRAIVQQSQAFVELLTEGELQAA